MLFLRVIIQVFSVFAGGVLLTGCAHLPVCRNDAALLKQVNVPMLVYHHIAVLPAGAGRAQRLWTLSPEKFEQQMRWLAEHGFHPVTVSEVNANLRDGSLLPAKPVVISFDDGWKDQYQGALPVLRKYNFPATFFIVTDYVGHSAYMNWEQVLELSSGGMDIGAHSHTHQKLSALPPEQARREIGDSKRILEERLRKPVNVFAYPYGSYDDDVISLVKAAGFQMAVTVTGLNGGYLFRADQSYTPLRYAVRGADNLEDIDQLRSPRPPSCSALFVSLMQDPSVFSSRESIDTLVNFAANSGINTLFVQVYRENKAWFPSKSADASPYNECLANLSEDPLSRLILQAHRQGIEVHAWLNMLSLTRNQEAPFINKYGTDVLTRDLKEKRKNSDYLIDGQYFLEPGDERVREDLLNIVGELLRAYPELDGIQFDYLRYPDMAPHYGYARNNVKRFKKATGLRVIDEESRVWKEWKRAQVTELLTLLVKAARALHPDIRVSVTGCMPYARAYHEAYQDWPSWINGGLVDFVTVMNYSPDANEFKRWLDVATEKTADLSKLKIAVGAYKLALAPKVFDQEIRNVEEQGLTAAVFHYGSLMKSPKLRAVVIKRNLD